MEILDQYTSATPSLQNTIDIFKGEWSSRLPSSLGEVQAGGIPLFEDSRIDWAAQQLGGFEGKTVLELGPLEGGHTYMLEQGGAASVTAVEANSRSFLKCLVIKEALGLNRSRLIYGDCIEFLRQTDAKFDIGIASGILYHMRNPAQLIALLAQSCNQLFIWTHYYDADIIAANPNLRDRFTAEEAIEVKGFSHRLYRQEYGTALGWVGFCGGSSHFSRWMLREDILACCKQFGFEQIAIQFEQPDHPHGPCFALAASKQLDQNQPTTSWADRPSDNSLSYLNQFDYRRQIKQLQQQNHQLQSSVEHLNHDLSSSQSRIAAMETSKFWQLRKSWFTFKKALGLPADE